MEIGELQKNANPKLKVELKNYKGHDFIDIRTYYEDKESGEWKPTKKGVTIDPDKAQELIGLIDKAQREMKGEESIPGIDNLRNDLEDITGEKRSEGKG